MVISWTIDRHYRGGRPRTYLAGMPQASVISANTWKASIAAAVRTSALAFMTGINAIDLGNPEPPELVCVHRYKNHLVLDPPTVDSITSANVHARFGTQRRRLGKNRF